MTQPASAPADDLERWYPPVPSLTPHRAVLTTMQCNVLGSLCEGKDNELIARDWGIAIDTVKTHLRGVYAALAATGRAHAVALVVSGAVDVRRARPSRRWPDPGPPIKPATLGGSGTYRPPS